MSTDPSKLEAVKQWQYPTGVAELSFLGFASYYRRFIEGFVKLTAPLHRLVAEFVCCKSRVRAVLSLGVACTEKCQASFD